jgi:hypothetical protein
MEGGTMGSYFLGRDMKSQITNGIGVAIRLVIVSDILKSNSPHIYLY